MTRVFAAIIGGVSLASCASTAATIGAIPTSRQVFGAVDAEDFKRTFETVSCDGNPQCYNSRPKVKIRNIACRPSSAQKAHCSYELVNSSGDGWKSKSADFEVGIGLDGKTAWLLSNQN
jgi:hypothetical protein